MAEIQIWTDKETLNLKVLGDWEIHSIQEVDTHLRAIDFNTFKDIQICSKGLNKIDTAGAWLLFRFSHRALKQGLTVRFVGFHKSLKDFFDRFPDRIERTKPVIRLSWWLYYLNLLGWRTSILCRRALNIISFLGESTTELYTALFGKGRLRMISMLVYLERVGFRALPIIGLLSLLVGIVMIYQGVFQLRRFGAEIFAIDMLAISFAREIAILATAIIIAGRSGSAFTAQIGTMKLNQEIDALKVLGMNPIEVLVLPRLIALMIALPLLSFFSFISGLLGGYIMCVFSLNVGISQYMNQLHQALTMDSFFVGLIKAPFFAFIISIVGCYEGMRVSGGAESVGSHTTRSVVESIFLVIVFNALFSVVFTYMGI